MGDPHTPGGGPGRPPEEGPGRGRAPAGAAGSRRRHRGSRSVLARALTLARAVFVATALVTAYYLLPLDQRGPSDIPVLVTGLVLVLLVFGWEVRAIARSPFPRLKAAEALGATLALFLILFASAYYLLDRSAPGSFSESLTRTDALYFALTTFSTTGFGDIAALSQTGRVLAMAQMTGGLLLVGVAAKVLANAVEAGLRRQGGGPPEHPLPAAHHTAGHTTAPEPPAPGTATGADTRPGTGGGAPEEEA
ncbi:MULTISPECIES: potassium channel family protein [Streptomyces]|uniref:Ion channel n=1 Tax=Streptomyces rubrolavendulae TaxID=285473 RepID=A0A1D8FWN9_9ACTN|nr:Ion channel [Streptomyces rubrolavendulae]